MTATDTARVLAAEDFCLEPDPAHHRRVADELIALRLRQLAGLAGPAGRLWPESSQAVSDLLARLPELDASRRAELADDPILHAAFVGLVTGLRRGDTAAAQRNLARLLPTLLVPAAELVERPVVLRTGPKGELGLSASGPRLRLARDIAGRSVRFTGAGGVLRWEAEGGLRGETVPGTPGCQAVPLVAGTPATAFDGEDERLPQMLIEVGTDPDGFATETVTPVPASAALREGIDASFGRLGAAWPAMRAEIEACVRLVVPMRSTRTMAFSNTAWQGAVFLREDFADPLFLIERLVHESSHLRLNAVMVFSPLHCHAWDERVESPFRAGPRPVTGLLHGALVFTRAAEALLRVSAGSPDELRGAGQARALLDKVAGALETLQTVVRLTGPGERLTSQIDTAHAALVQRCGDARPPQTPSAYLTEEI